MNLHRNNEAKGRYGMSNLCEHRNPSETCDRCAIITLLKMNAALGASLGVKIEELQKENAALRKRIADAAIAPAVNTTQLRKLMEKATPGPWSAFSESALTIRSGHKIVVDYVSSDYGAYQCVGEDDANLIASAINAMPELLDAYDRFVEVTRERDAANARAEQFALLLCEAREYIITEECNDDALLREINEALAAESAPKEPNEA